LPRPRTNVDRLGDKVDCQWPQTGLAVELVSYRFHDSRHAFEADVARRRRSNHLAYTYGDVFERAARTATELAARLATSPP
jgi:L-fucose isomerase-like protein